MTIQPELVISGRHALPMTHELMVADAAIYLAGYTEGSDHELAQGLELMIRQGQIRSMYGVSVNNEAYLQAFYSDKENK